MVLRAYASRHLVCQQRLPDKPMVECSLNTEWGEGGSHSMQRESPRQGLGVKQDVQGSKVRAESWKGAQPCRTIKDISALYPKRNEEPP